MAIETSFNVPFVAAMALREKQIQQNYRPIIAVHKWFARRPGTLFRGLTLAEFGNGRLADIFYEGHDFPGVSVADPFMGGGTPLIEANRVGCDVLGFDINPMSAWIVREEVEHLDLKRYAAAASKLQADLSSKVGDLYRTRDVIYGIDNVPVKYFLWVKVIECEVCRKDIDLFPGYLIVEDKRHPRNVLVCAACGDLNEVVTLDSPGGCSGCSAPLRVGGPAKRGQCPCPHCCHSNRYPRPGAGPMRHRLFAIEYFSPDHKASHQGRFFKKPDTNDLVSVVKASERWHGTRSEFVPDDSIPNGDETDRLHRWGYSRYRDLFNERQLLGLEASCQLIAQVKEERVRHALATNLSDLLRYQNMLCRYDIMALKSLDIFSVHGFPVGLVQVESNLLGIINGNGTNVGSGGWSNIVEKYTKAKRYCDEPFEVRVEGNKKVQVSVQGEWIGETRKNFRSRKVSILCSDSSVTKLPAGSLDAVFTDPPYFGNVQYGELMDFCYVWLRRLAAAGSEGFEATTAKSAGELTGNTTQARGLEHFTEGLANVYRNMAHALKPGAPLAFTYHHNKIEAYHAVGVAILDAGLTCSASLPCPAEMGGSIHIHGTGSSIVDTVFVCRVSGQAPTKWLFDTPEALAKIVACDLADLRAAGMKPTPGDTRCVVFGHLTRMAIWNLRDIWRIDITTSKKLHQFALAVGAFGSLDTILAALNRVPIAKLAVDLPLFNRTARSGVVDAVSF